MEYQDNILIIDFNHLAMRCFFVQKPEDIEEFGYQYFKYLVLNNIFKAISEFKPTKVVIAIDGKKVWRRKLWRFYKVNRKMKRDSDDHDWASFFSAFNEFIDELDDNFPFKIVKHNMVEADDIAGVLASWDELKHDKKTIITSDTDYIQLLQFDNVVVYDQKNGRFLKSDNPKRFLIKKCVMGDKKDYVPGIKEEHKWKDIFITHCKDKKIGKNEEVILEKLKNEDYRNNLIVEFMTEFGIKPSTVRGYGEKTAEKMIANGELKQLLNDNEDFKKRYKRNVKLLDLTKQPEQIKDAIKKKYNDADVGDMKNLLKYFVQEKFTNFIENASIISATLRPLTRN
jgi:5'-3' exonuclease